MSLWRTPRGLPSRPLPRHAPSPAGARTGWPGAGAPEGWAEAWEAARGAGPNGLLQRLAPPPGEPEAAADVAAAMARVRECLAAIPDDPDLEAEIAAALAVPVPPPVPAPAAPPPPGPAPAEASPEAQRAPCPACGAPRAAGWRFCMACGRRFPGSPA